MVDLGKFTCNLQAATLLVLLKMPLIHICEYVFCLIPHIQFAFMLCKLIANTVPSTACCCLTNIYLTSYITKI